MEAQEENAARSRFWLAAIPVALAFVFHAPVLFNGFVWDDRSLIVNNPRWDGPHAFFELFVRDYGFDLGGQARGYYRPLFTLLTATLHQVSGPSPLVFHAFGLLLFCLGVWLFFIVLGRAASHISAKVSLFAASLCAVHPLHTEVAAIYASLPDWICQIGMMLACLLLVSRPPETRFGRMRHFKRAFYIALIPALMKETAFFLQGSLIVSLLASLLISRGRVESVRGYVLAGFTAGLGVGLAMRLMLLPDQSTSMNVLAPFSAEGGSRALLACANAARLFIAPWQTVFIRELAVQPSMGAAITMGIFILIGAIIWLWMLRTGRLISAIMLGWLGAGLYNLSLVAASGLPFSERYISVVPAIYFIALGIAQFPSLQRSGRLAAVAFIAYCGIHTIMGSLKCSDSVTFFAALHDERPREIYGMTGLADALFWDKGDFERASSLAVSAMSLNPDDPTVRTMGQLLARIEILEGRPADALRHLDWAETLQPNYPIIENLRADALGQLGRTEEALAANERAIKLDSTNPAYHMQRARLLLREATATDDEIWRSLQRARALGAELPSELNSLAAVAAARETSIPQNHN